jgi:5-methylcytosine-specific restriction endonuclease McrA
MSSDKQKARQRFRTQVFERDGHVCRVCGAASEAMDAHHITDRHLLPNGGYVPENGISLCPPCHLQAEVFHRTGTAAPGRSPEDLYRLIGSDVEKARRASERL